MSPHLLRCCREPGKWPVSDSVSSAHKSAYLQRQREQQVAEGRRRMWFDFLNAAPERAK